MKVNNRYLVLLFILEIFHLVQCTEVIYKTLRSDPITLPPGGVYKKYQPMDWPSGHIAIRSFNAELVQENGESVPLSDVYLHHWVVDRALVEESGVSEGWVEGDPRFKLWPNSGTCENQYLGQWFGLGSETRKTDLSFPEPYGIETGNPKAVPEGWRESWYVQIHAIDTRGALNPWECLECRCAAYNATVSESGRKIPEGYLGGLLCCHPGVRCAVKPEFPQTNMTFYLQYTIGYVPFEACVVPLRVYILDVTDNGLPFRESRNNSCQIEYTVEQCTQPDGQRGSCEQHKVQHIAFPDSSRLIYTVGHLHAGGTGIAVWAEDGSLICDSTPVYGKGSDAGDEAGYVTGMEVCRHHAAVVRVQAGERLQLRSSYASDALHTGVMGLVYMAVVSDADYDALSPACRAKLEETTSHCHFAKVVSVLLDKPAYLLLFALVGVATTVAVVVILAHKRRKTQEYQALLVE